MLAKLNRPKIVFILILLLGVLLRFYQLSPYLQFLGDEGRDALVVKRMIVDRQWTLLGPTASVGGFYIGPLYYYFILPFLWLWHLDPVGPAVFSALVGLATIVLTWAISKRFWTVKTALFASLLVALSPKMTYISRFSWNPNPTPLFTLLSIFLLFWGAKKRSALIIFLSGVSLGILQELHYTNLILIPIIGISLLTLLPFKKAFFYGLLIFVGFLLGNSPYFLFEIRHNFPNIRSVLEFTTRGHGAVISPRSLNLIWLFNDIFRRLYETVFGFKGSFLDTIYFSSLIGFIFWAVTNLKNRLNRPKIFLLLIWIIIGAFGIGSYQGQLLDHYFGFLYPLPFFLVGLTLSLLVKRKILLPLSAVLISALLFMEVKNLYFWQPPNNLVDQTKQIDQIVIRMAQEKPFNFALLTLGNSDHAYRYFLEVWGKPPTIIQNPQLDPARQSVTDQLIVVCEGSDCKPLGHPLWEVAGFGRGEIVEREVGPAGIIVYKLVHYKPS